MIFAMPKRPKHHVEWIDAGREPQAKPDPRFPHGVDLDMSKGQSKNCLVPLPYPAKRCGQYFVTCNECGLTAMCTTAGRPDDPRSIKLACRGH